MFTPYTGRVQKPSDREIAAAKRRGKVTRTLLRDSVWNVPGRLTDWVAWAQAFLDQVPDAAKTAARFEITTQEGYGGPEIEVAITYEDDETDAEYAERARDVSNRLGLWQLQERAEYEALKAKYDPPVD